MKRICLLDLNYTLVANQLESKSIRPFSKRMEAEEYRADLVEKIKDDHVIIITARPEYQKNETLSNIKRKITWIPNEAHFNDLMLEPHIIKESILKRFIFPKYGTDPDLYYAVESNAKTRAMYRKYGIEAVPYSEFIKSKEENQLELF